MQAHPDCFGTHLSFGWMLNRETVLLAGCCASTGRWPKAARHFPASKDKATKQTEAGLKSHHCGSVRGQVRTDVAQEPLSCNLTYPKSGLSPSLFGHKGRAESTSEMLPAKLTVRCRPCCRSTAQPTPQLDTDLVLYVRHGISKSSTGSVPDSQWWHGICHLGR